MIDVTSSLTRDELEEFIKPLLERINVPVEVALKDAGLSASDLDSIEVIGGCTRVPSIKTKLSEIFGKQLSFTLNQDEAIARGNAFICAMHSPTLRVRPFKFEDFNPYSVSYYWDKEEEDDDHLEVFPRGGLFPSTKIITLFRKGDFEVEARYTNRDELPVGTEDVICKWNITGVKTNAGESTIATKLKLRNDPSGFYNIESAHTVEEKLVKEPVEPKEDEEVDEDKEPEYREVKKVVKKDDLVISAITSALPEEKRQELTEKENAMVMEDKLVADTEDRKNALEEYIYDLRGKLEEKYKDFASEQEKTKLGDLLMKAEDWLYDDGYDSTKAKYIAKYEELASIGNIIRGRFLAKEEEKKQALREKQEAKQAAAMAEKLAAQRGQSQGEPEKKEDAPKEDQDIEMGM